MKPAIYQDKNRHTAIAFGVERGKVLFTVMQSIGLDMERLDVEAFNAKYEPMPEYPVERAAQLYLKSCASTVCDPAVRRNLETLANGGSALISRSNLSEGESKMSATETKKPMPQPAKTKPTSGAKKPAAKKPAAKPEVAAKKTAPGKTATKPEVKKATPAKKAEAAAAAAAAAKKPGRAPAFSDDMKIKVLVGENPKRGSAAERFALYKNGMTVAAYLDAGGKRPDISWDAKQGWIQVG